MTVPTDTDDKKGQKTETPNGKGEGGEQIKIPGVLPALLLNDVVIFPNTIVPLVVSSEPMIKLINDALADSKMLGTFARVSETESELPEEQFFRIGTATQILKMFRVPDGSIRILVQGLVRVERKRIFETEPYLKVEIETLPMDRRRSLKVEALMWRIQQDFGKLVDSSAGVPEEMKIAAMNVSDAGALADIIASNLNVTVAEKQKILEANELEERLTLVASRLSRELKLAQIGSEIQTKVDTEMAGAQKEYYLREQLKAIRKELGEESEISADIKEFEEKIKSAGLPAQAADAAQKELERMRRMNVASAEYIVSRTYVEWLVSLPWAVSSEDEIDIKHAEAILNRDHYGLEDVKNRILEFLVVRKLKKSERGPILCFVGPPGVGKTSLGQSIAHALNRQFVRMSLGGMRDEAEIRGHRRTYVGALPGRIIQSIRRVGVNNPVFMLDEIDKLGSDFRGDPSSAMLEVLDPAQNATFQDHYVDVEFDLSKIFFITTANDRQMIPGPLRDRMEIIEIPSYITTEKVQIARHYLVPRQIDATGLKKGQIRFTDDGLTTIVEGYTREAGVRRLEQQIASVCRKVARGIVTGETERAVVTEKTVGNYLGPAHFIDEQIGHTSRVGVAHGLAWTPVGGDVLVIEATWMPGARGLQVTGHLGDVMKESAQIALSYLRANAERFGIDNETLARRDVHIHVPAGATPKDGPSAGITIATALASLFTNQPVRHEIGMTGEITLSGNVLPIGGLREKIVAASRYGLRQIILPRSNEKDLFFVPDYIKKTMKFTFVDEMHEVVTLALLSKGGDNHRPSSSSNSRSVIQKRKRRVRS